MNTKIVQYANGDTGYEKIVSDFKEMFSWDSSPEFTEGNTKYTTFKMPGEGDSCVGLRVRFGGSTSTPQISAYANNGSSTYTSSLDYISHFTNVAYAYGDGFFVVCGGHTGFPCSDATNARGVIVGVVRSRNLLTGDTDYCSFMVDSNRYYFYARDLMSGSARSNLSLTTNSFVGAAISLHDPDRLWVADNILLLTAIPDTITACMSQVAFNGKPYMRLGRILIPT